MAADDIVGIDIDGDLAADLPFAFESRSFEGVDATGGPREKAAVQVDAVGQPIREQEGGVVVSHARADLFPKNGFIQQFQGLIGNLLFVHVLIDQPTWNEDRPLVVQLAGGPLLIDPRQLILLKKGQHSPESIRPDRNEFFEQDVP